MLLILERHIHNLLWLNISVILQPSHYWTIVWWHKNSWKQSAKWLDSQKHKNNQHKDETHWQANLPLRFYYFIFGGRWRKNYRRRSCICLNIFSPIAYSCWFISLAFTSLIYFHFVTHSPPQLSCISCWIRCYPVLRKLFILTFPYYKFTEGR